MELCASAPASRAAPSSPQATACMSNSVTTVLLRSAKASAYTPSAPSGLPRMLSVRSAGYSRRCERTPRVSSARGGWPSDSDSANAPSCPMSLNAGGVGVGVGVRVRVGVGVDVGVGGWVWV